MDGSVGRAPGNRCLYPETDAENRAADGLGLSKLGFN